MWRKMLNWKTLVGGKGVCLRIPHLIKKCQSLFKLFPKTNLLSLKLGRGTYMY